VVDGATESDRSRGLCPGPGQTTPLPETSPPSAAAHERRSMVIADSRELRMVRGTDRRHMHESSPLAARRISRDDFAGPCRARFRPKNGTAAWGRGREAERREIEAGASLPLSRDDGRCYLLYRAAWQSAHFFEGRYPQSQERPSPFLRGAWLTAPHHMALEPLRVAIGRRQMCS
jgi:hypothetical protein